MSEDTAELVAGAVARFGDAVHDLVGKRPDTVDRDDYTQAIVRDSLYNELQEAKHGEQVGQGGRRPPPESRPPGWTSALSLAVRIDQRVAAWWPATPPDAHGLPVTVRRLYALVDHKWRHQDVTVVRQMTHEVAAWVDRVRTLLPTEDAHQYELKAPCPACGETFISVDHAGEQVQRYVLQANLSSARCQACEASWAPEDFVALARAIGGLPGNVLE